MITLHRPEAIFSWRHAPTWLLLPLAAGAVNTGAFLTCRRFVSSVTGSATQLGMSAHGTTLLLDAGLVLFCFVLGAMASVLAIEGRVQRGRRPLHAVPLIIVAATLILVALLGSTGALGAYGALDDGHDEVLIALLSFAMGLQNAAVSTSTGQLVRTTHLTGPASDLGVHLATSFFNQGTRRIESLKHALLRAGKILAFASGAVLMVPLGETIGYTAFLVPALAVGMATMLSFMPAEEEARVEIPSGSATS